MSQLPHRPYRLQPSKYFFDSLPFYLTYFISRMPGGSSVNCRASTIIILAHVRRYPRFSYTCYASTCVVGFICSQCHTSILIPYFIGELHSSLAPQSQSPALPSPQLRSRFDSPSTRVPYNSAWLPFLYPSCTTLTPDLS